MGDSCIVLTLISFRSLVCLEDQAYAVAWVDPNIRHFTVLDSRGNANDEWNAELVLSIKEDQLQHNADTGSVSIEIYTKSCFLLQQLGRVCIGFTDFVTDLGDFVRDLGGISERTYDINDSFGVVQGQIMISARLERRFVPDGVCRRGGSRVLNRRPNTRSASVLDSLAPKMEADIDEAIHSTAESSDSSLTSNDSRLPRKFKNRLDIAGKEMEACSTTTLTKTSSSTSKSGSQGSREKRHELQMPNFRAKWPSLESINSRVQWLSLQPIQLDPSGSFPYHDWSSRYNKATSIQPSPGSFVTPTNLNDEGSKHFERSQKQALLPSMRRSTCRLPFSAKEGIVYQKDIVYLPFSTERQVAHVGTAITGKGLPDSQSCSESPVVHVANLEHYEKQQNHQYDIENKPQTWHGVDTGGLETCSKSLVASRVRQFEEMIHFDGKGLHFFNGTQKKMSQISGQKTRNIVDTGNLTEEQRDRLGVSESSILKLPLVRSESDSQDTNQERCSENKRSILKDESRPSNPVDTGLLQPTFSQEQRSTRRPSEYGLEEESWEQKEASSDREEESVDDAKTGGDVAAGEADEQQKQQQFESGRRTLLTLVSAAQSPVKSSHEINRERQKASQGWWGCSCLSCCASTSYASEA